MTTPTNTEDNIKAIKDRKKASEKQTDLLLQQQNNNIKQQQIQNKLNNL